jgi:outer membrane protein assembly factor BamB
LLAGVSLCTAGASEMPKQATGAQNADAVAFQINAAHVGNINFSNGFAAPLRQIWYVNLGGTVSYPIIADGMVFVTVDDSTDYDENTALVYALDLTTGAVLWEKLLPSREGWSNATYDRGHLFVLNDLGQLQSINPKTGKVDWKVQLSSSDSYVTAPVAGNGQVFVAAGGYPNQIIAVSEANGAVDWSFALSTEEGYLGVPALGEKQLYATDEEGAYALSPATGANLWSYSACNEDYDSGVAPLYFKKKVYVRQYNCNDSVLDAADGTIQNYFVGNLPPTFYPNQKNSMITLVNGSLYDYNLKSGNVTWQFAGDGELDTAPLVVNGVVIEGSQEGNLYALDADSGVTVWSTKVGSPISSPCETQCDNGGPLTGLAAGEGTLVVPAGDQITAYVPQ